jgi:lipoate-protein ligase A
MRLRLIVDPPASGVWNMAVDEALLESAAGGGPATLRFYEWNEPTLSLGYFQARVDRDQHAASRSCPLVRRASGGGAILHDRELTYSIAMPLTSRFGRAADSLYARIHGSLIESLADAGVPAILYAPEEGSGVRAAAIPPFLCFERRSAGDVIGGQAGRFAHKIAGSAQRRQRGALLQHGSILLARSLQAPELPGIAELAGVVLSADVLVAQWTPRLWAALGTKGDRGTLSTSEQTLAETFARDRFGSPDWETRR